MKTIRLITTALLLFVVFAAGAQTDSKGFRFQGFADTPEGTPLKMESVTIRFTIYPKTGTGFTFIETQEQKTDNFGVFYANVGEMKPDDLQKLNFRNDYWMKVEVKKTVGGMYSTISDTELVATPYARHAANGVPVGTIMPFGGALDQIPGGWLLCDGAEYDGGDPLYEQLYNIIGSHWGSSSVGAFNVPELRGNFMRGQDKGAGNDGDAGSRVAINSGGSAGDKVGSYQMDDNKNHIHGINNSGHGHVFYDKSNPNSISDNANDRNYGSSSTGHSKTTGSAKTGISISSAGDSEQRPLNVYVAYIIKY